MISNLEIQQKIFENWLGNYHSNKNPWRLGNTNRIGRGLIATRDININDVILCEPALIVGPVGNEKDDIICVTCFKFISEADVCSNCWLPMCFNCSEIDKHSIEECSLLRSLNISGNDDRSRQLVKAVTFIRGLFINETKKNVLNLLQANRTNDMEKVISEMLKDVNGSNRSLRDELASIASVFNTNAFQVVADLTSNRCANLRGLYPIMSLINHRCNANGRYSIDSNYIISLYARKRIKKGDEICISYAKILWSTPSRQSYLKITKQFTCNCDRCLDPTEANTYLSALKCLDRTCPGLLLPVDPTKFVSPWKCLICSRLSEYKSILRFQKVVSCMVNGTKDMNSIQEIDEMINNRLLKVLPISNQNIVEMKMNIISINAKGQSTDTCKLIEKYCMDILNLLEKLQAGECVLKGVVEYRLFQCRQQILDTGKYSMDEFESNQEKLLMNAWSILKGNISAPADLSNIVEKYILCKIRI